MRGLEIEEMPSDVEEAEVTSEMPAWLEEVGFPTVTAEEEGEQPPPVVEMKEELEAPSPLEEEERPEVEAPTWLAELQPSEVEAEVEEGAPPLPVVEGEEGLAPAELPDWLRPPEGVEAGLAPAEIPAWLQAMRPAEVEEAAPEAEEAPLEAVETRGLLAGIRGVLPIEPIISAPRIIEAREVPEKPGAGIEQASVFEEIVARRPPALTEVEVRARKRILGAAARWLIYLFVALAAIVPFLLPGRWFDQADVIETTDTRDAHQAIEALDGNSFVLVAYDYDPSAAAEMNLQAEAVLRHLIERNSRVLIISLYPSGPEIAQETMERIAPDKYQYGENYVNLGYLPGQEMALQVLGLNPLEAIPGDYRDQKSLTDWPVMQGFDPGRGIQNVALIVLLTDSQSGLRSWVEQVVSFHGLKMVAGVTAAVKPYAVPYRDSNQLAGLISGLPGAAEYETIAGRPSSAIDSLDSLSAVHLVIVILMLVGNVEYLVSRLRGQT